MRCTRRIKPVSTVLSPRSGRVWPSTSAATHRGKITVAGVTSERRLATKSTPYRICIGSFAGGSDRQKKWKDLIHEGFRQWSAATDGLVQFYPLADCASDPKTGTTYADITTKVLEKVETPDVTPAKALADVSNYVDGLRADLVLQGVADAGRNYHEIYMFDDMRLAPIKDFLVFANISTEIGYFRQCWYNAANVWDDAANMCAVSYDESANPVATDIIVRRGAYDSGTGSDRGRSAEDSLRLPFADARFNTCFNDLSNDYGSAYTSFVHEVGHVIGISHPPYTDSVVNYDDRVGNLTEPDCSLHPIDVMMVYALYQNLF